MLGEESMIRWELRCIDCDKLMQYDADVYQSSSFMEWMCWKCGQGVVTSDLQSTLLYKMEEEE